MNIHLTLNFRRLKCSFLYVCLLVLSVVVPASANKSDKAQIEADIRSAMVQGGYRQGPITVLAELSLNLGSTHIPGQYRLLWNSRENWLERIDVGPSAELLIAKGQQQFRQSNGANPDIWISLARNAFDIHKLWHDGSEWRFDAVKLTKISGVSAQCATFKGTHVNRIEICIDPDTKDVLQVQTDVIARYSQFELLNSHRYPKHIELVLYPQAAPLLIAEVKELSSKADVPQPNSTMEAQPNCSSMELTGGTLNKKIQPLYPLQAKNQRISGIVRLAVTVEPSGSVNIQRVVQSATPLLDDAAKEAVRQWTYAPTMCHGTPIPQTFMVTVNFSLRSQ